MPIVQSAYKKSPFYMLNGHWETVIPSMFFKVKEDLYTRERLELSDGDFLDIDSFSAEIDRKNNNAVHAIEFRFDFGMCHGGRIGIR